MLIGHIAEIVRYPIKSFQGENVAKTKIMEYGLYGDRSHAFKDETRRDKYLTITQFPEMAQYKARFIGTEKLDEYPKVEITTPTGEILHWGDENLTQEILNKSKRMVSLVQYSPTHVPVGAIEEENIQLVTDASLAALEQLWGETEVDYRRFRPNLLLSLKEKTPFIEEKWFGKRIKIGSTVELQLKRHCERCMIITVNPENAERNSSLLKTIVKNRNNHFGVYASVLKTGDLQIGDEVHLLD